MAFFPDDSVLRNLGGAATMGPIVLANVPGVLLGAATFAKAL